jgi:ATP-dependent Lhr-like helicase
MLDTLMSAGEVVWVGVEPLGEHDGRVALYLTDHLQRLRPPVAAKPDVEGRAAEILEYLQERGASFFTAVHDGTGGGFPTETVDALWDLVWQGFVTNDTMQPLRAYARTEETRGAKKRARGAPFRSRRLVPPRAEGRWSRVGASRATKSSATEWGAAMAQQLLSRHGIVTRETVAAESVTGGFSAVYTVLKAMEDAGRIRRGYFVAGLGAAQFAMPAALDLLRSMRDVPETPRTAVVAATDPANPYGASVKWPTLADPTAASRGPTRAAGALVVLVDGHAAAYLRRGERELLLFLPESEPSRSRVGREAARMLLHLAATREGRRGMLIAEINGVPAPTHPAAHLFVEEGFAATAMGLQARTERLRPRGYGSLDPTGIGIAATNHGGGAMTQQRRNMSEETLENTRPRANEDSELEHNRVRSTNDRDQEMEREGIESTRNRGYDGAVRGEDLGDVDDRDIDPDSATSENDREDMDE